MRNYIKSHISGKMVLILFVLTNVIYVIMLTITIPEVMSYSGGMKLMDMMPTGYNAEYVNALLKALGEKGRNAYLFEQIPVDMVYPSLFAVSSCLILAYFLNKLGKLDGILFYLCFIPVFAGAFDYCENIGIINILNDFPTNTDLLSQATSVFSVLKSLCTTIYFIILIICLIALGIKKLKNV